MDVVRIVRTVFGLVGIGLLVGALIAVQHTRSFLADAVSAPGTVQDLVARSSTDSDGHSSTTFAPVVRFTTAQGESVTFFSSTSSYPPAYRVGESVEVLYRADDPGQARIHDWFSLWGLATILGGLGTVFTAVAVGLLLVGRRGRRDGLSDPPPDDADDDDDADDEGADDESDDESDDDLLRTGVRVTADVQRVQATGTYAPNGSEKHRIVAQWLDPDRHEVRVFTSADIPFDPAPFLGGTVDVLVAPDDPARHVVDLSFLPRAAR